LHLPDERNTVKIGIAAVAVLAAVLGLAGAADPYPWLETTEGELRGEMVYNFWQDRSHPRGIWRRTTMASYSAAEPQWETLLDLDALAEAEDTPWAWGGARCLTPEYTHCMVALSRGSGGAMVYREFDTRASAFVESGFTLPEARSSVDWRDENTLWVGTDFGPGTLTSSGYPRVVKLWTRGTPLTAARTVYEGLHGDIGAFGYSQHTPDGRHDLVVRTSALFTHESFLVIEDRLVKLDLPADSKLEGFFKGHMLVSLRSDWTVGGTTYRQGALLGLELDQFLQGMRDFELLFEPSSQISLESVRINRDHVFLSTLDDARSRLHAVNLAGGAWKNEELPLPGLGTMDVAAASTCAAGFNCTVCAHQCPVPGGAIRLRKVATWSLDGRPATANQSGTDPDICNGCGVCEYVCPPLDDARIALTSDDGQQEEPCPGDSLQCESRSTWGAPHSPP
jgi:prolyl oligopeptidase PreP (S9A serine peptidase family)